MVHAKPSVDSELLGRYAGARDERAFAQLVESYAPLVLGAAQRRLGDRGLAEEVAQNVFATLARKAGRLRHHPRLAAWLHKTATYESLRAREKEATRRKYLERWRGAAAAAAGGGEVAGAGAEDVARVLDEAMAGALSELDREILLRRYWREQPFKEIAHAVGKSAAATEKRAARAVDKLGGWLRRRGVGCGGAALGAVLAAELGAARAADAGVAAAGGLARAALGEAAAGASHAPGAALWGFVTMKSKVATTGAVLAALAASAGGGWLVGHHGRASADPAHGRAAAASAPSRALSARASTRSAAQRDPAQEARRASLRELLQTARAELASGGRDPAARIRAAARVALIGADDLPAAMALLAEFEGGLYGQRELAALVLGRWGEVDGEAACEFALARMDPPMMGMHPVRHPLSAWASRHPAAAMAWFQRRKAADGRLSGGRFGQWMPISELRWVMGAWGAHDAPAAARAFGALETQAERDGALTGFMELAADAAGREHLLDAVWQAGDGGVGQRATDRVWRLLDEWSAHDPAGLAAWIDTKVLPPSEEFMVCKAVLGSWLLDDAPAAAGWWLGREAGGIPRDQRWTRLVDAWSDVDPYGAAEWLAAQPLDASHAGAVRTLSREFARTDPGRAFAWALQLPDAELRRVGAEQALGRWHESDPAAASTALQAAELDADLRAALEAQVGGAAAPPAAGLGRRNLGEGRRPE